MCIRDRLSSLAEQGDMEKIKKYLSATTEKISDYNLHFCENQAVDSVFGYYSTLAQMCIRDSLIHLEVSML